MIEHIYEQIPGWFTFPKFYKAMIDRIPQKGKALELGTYKGKSFSYLLIESLNSGKDVSVTGLDGFGWEDVRPAFDGFMKPFEGKYSILSGNAVELAPTFADKSLDFVFIDLSHTYEDTLREIKTYIPKIKPGGIIAGHDYHPDWPGVVKAVNEVFKGDYKFDWAEVIWYKEL